MTVDRKNRRREFPVSGLVTLLLVAVSAGALAAQESGGLELTAHWARFTDSKYNFGEKWETLKSLQPVQQRKQYSDTELSVLLPPDDAGIGDVWKIDVRQIIPILRQLHAGATHRLHHGGPEGAWGCVVAENESYRRIRSRIHAEFRLKDGFYVPSQFAGDLVVDRQSGQIIAFRLAVPPRRNNVDLNWETGKEVTVGDKDGNPRLDQDGQPMKMPMNIADIGYCERLELVGGDWDSANTIQWDEQLDPRVVDKNFQLKFYCFAQIDWLPWEEAVAKSVSSGKPLHVVALFGSLDDESC